RRFTPFRDQRAELRPLQNLRHQGSQPEYYLGSARGRRRAELSEYVSGPSDRSPRWTNRRAIGISAPKHRPSVPITTGAGRVRHDAALIEAFKGGGHARSEQLLRAGSKQSILLNAAAPRA